MKTNKLLGSLITVFMGMVFFIPGHALAAAFGVSPPWIENENLKPGSNFVYVINLSANELSEEMKVNAEFSGDPEVAQWLSVLNKDSLVMPEGQNIVPMSVAVNIPSDAKVGKYQGSLKLTLSTESGSQDNIAVLLGGNIAIRLGVTDRDVVDYWVQTISTEPLNEGEPIHLNVTLKNLGNTDVTGLLTKVSVVDMKTGEQLVSGTAEEFNMPVYPQTMAEVKQTIDAPDLKVGNYWLDVESFQGGKSVYKNRLYLSINPPLSNNVLTTAVEVQKEGWIKPAASEEGLLGNSKDARIKTSVTVRAPLSNALIVVIIGVLLVLTGIVTKIYLEIKKKHH